MFWLCGPYVLLWWRKATIDEWVGLYFNKTWFGKPLCGLDWCMDPSLPTTHFSVVHTLNRCVLFRKRAHTSVSKSLSTCFKWVRYFFKWHYQWHRRIFLCVCTYVHTDLTSFYFNIFRHSHINRTSAQSSSSKLSSKNNNISVVLLILPLLYLAWSLGFIDSSSSATSENSNFKWTWVSCQGVKL